MKYKTLALAMTSALILAGCKSSNSSNSPDDGKGDGPDYGWTLGEPVVSDTAKVNSWFTPEAERISNIHTEMETAQNSQLGKAKNIILFVGDGMGISTVTAGRILEGQVQGGLGEDHKVIFETFPHTAFSKTYNADAQTPDSAGTMTAMMTGVKNRQAVLGMDEEVHYVGGDDYCDDYQNNQLVTALDLAKMAGKSTGVVTTTTVTHATPAGTYGAVPNRNWEYDTAADNICGDDLAKQLINYQSKYSEGFAGIQTELPSGMDVILGGGLNYFIENEGGLFPEGKREDEDLTALWLENNPTGQFIENKNELAGIDFTKTDSLLGLFSGDYHAFDLHREEDTEEPSLSDMTEAALKVLQKNTEEGFFLMVEGGRIDHGHHFGSTKNSLYDFMAFTKAVEKAIEMTESQADETLIIVTADHSHTFTLGGQPKRGNHILGLVHDVNDELVLADDGYPFTSVHYANSINGGKGLDIPLVGSKGTFDENGRKHPGTQEDVTADKYLQQATVPMFVETHAGEDVGIWATGPGAEQVRGVLEQNTIFNIMERAGNLIENAEIALKQ
ncbi:alkaline phosphatase [Vibrio comitans]|uniref:Alkaline phosphatase n=1 Tax=Vibrio comitans NBRC 102076 TaxID=1219078 RepID=A0A4Y3IPL7_9VIBR|nr:alkaline phosphatase [Vibrio comitans]GEA60788.1 alkaline phosphatase [Vibrio comitans NBRC 102076]